MSGRRTLVLAGLAACGGEARTEVTILRGEPDAAYLDLRVIATGLDADDGAAVEVQVGAPGTAGERLGLGRTTVADGGFEVFFPAVHEPIYKQKVVWIDVDDDGACGNADHVTSDFQLATEDLTWRLTWPSPFWTDGACGLVTTDWPEGRSPARSAD